MSAVSLLNPDDVSKLLSSSGPLSIFFNGYEERSEQLELTKKITDCFNNSSIGVFEAETGIGKSLAYLLPAISWAFKNQKRVIISTATINLQQQLVDKDVPTALQILNLNKDDVKPVLVKGRSNFICLRRFHQFSLEPDLFSNYADDLELIKNELKNDACFTGSRSDFSFFINNSIWSNICSESDNCLGNKCSFFEKCYVMNMRKDAEKALILIANHHLLFTDLAARYESDSYDGTVILPASSYIILDEAHAIEDAARSSFSENLNSFFLQKQINALYKSRKGKNLGALHEMIVFSSRADLLETTVSNLNDLNEAYKKLEDKAMQLIPNTNTWSIFQGVEEDINSLMVDFENFYNTISSVNKKLGTILGNIEEEHSEELAVHQAKVILRRLESIELFSESFLKYNDYKNHVFWFDTIHTQSANVIEFIKTPITIGKFMQNAVFSPMKTVICTSATLRIYKSFNFWINNMGLDNFSEKTIIQDHFDSPFPYRSNVLFNIPVNAPLPQDKNFKDFIHKAVTNLIESSNGRALVLFTSYDLLRSTCEYVRESSNIEKIKILCQGENNRSRLLNEFKTNISSCLFATESFWAGVDVQGDSLSHVILVKLPFEVPSHPVVHAKALLIENSGRNSFFNLSIPSAVIKFKQGFGRLMRSKTDRGVISVLDTRLLKKSYGRFFIDSIPITKRTFANFDDILYNIKKFF